MFFERRITLPNSVLQVADPKRIYEFYFNTIKIAENKYSFDFTIEDLVKNSINGLKGGPQQSLYLVFKTPFFDTILLGLRDFPCKEMCPLQEMCLSVYYLDMYGALFAKIIVEKGEIFLKGE